VASDYKCLGQSAPAATTSTDLYTVPAATKCVVSSIVICNRGAAGTFRVSVAVAGAVLATKQYIYFDVSIAANETFIATIGLGLDSTDVIRVYASSGDMSFSAFGVEIT
jgi:hypothetical protein